MKKAIVISSNAEDTRIAITEDGKLAELFLETPDTQRMVGDIYLGEVMKVIPGMNAAFINVGLKQDAFLHFSDIDTGSIDEYADWFDDDDDDDDDDIVTGPDATQLPERRNDDRGPRDNRGAQRDNRGGQRDNRGPRNDHSPHDNRRAEDDRGPRNDNSPRDNRRAEDDRGSRNDNSPRDNRRAEDDRGPRNDNSPRDNRRAEDDRGPHDHSPRDNSPRDNRNQENRGVDTARVEERAPDGAPPVTQDLDPNWRPKPKPEQPAREENRPPQEHHGGERSGRRDDRGGRRDDRGGRGDDRGPRRDSRGGPMNARHQMQQEQQRRVNIQKGQNILVQVTREPVGNKGVRVTTRISLPGRFLVLIPFDGRIGVSRKVQNIRERRRLRRVVKSLLPEGFGAIIRTVAENKDETLIKQDLQSLIDTYKEIEQKAKTEKAPILAFKDLSISTSVIRDLFTRDVEFVYTDSKKLFKDIGRYVSWAAPNLLEKVVLYDEKEPIFDKFGIEQEIETTLSRKVYLPSGGYLIIEHTEAMVVVDVNSGRYAAKSDQELNSLRTNLESAREIARQVRLRDLGGIIVIDFIDMHEDRNKKKVYDEIRKEFKRDRAKSTILPLSDFGVMQITRQRMRQTLLHSVSEPCVACSGTGMVQSKHTIMSTIDRWLRRAKTTLGERKFILEVNPLMEHNLTEGLFSPIWKMGWKHHISVKVVGDDEIGVDEFKLLSVKQKKDVTADLK